jgi:two-component system chemotaxis response regulator CheB
VARALPAELSASVFVVLHLPSDSTSALPAILDRAGPLPAAHPRDGEPIVPGRVYVAPPDHHLAVEPGRVRVVRGPRENRHRPAIDRLFRSAASAYGRRVVGVVLSGTLDDGVAGLSVIKQRGGIAVVQDPSDALYTDMPDSALKYVAVDYCLPAAWIGSRLADLAGRPAVAEGAPAMASEDRDGILEAAGRDPTVDRGAESTTPSAFVCPECGGTLWEMRDGELVRYRCRVGHSYSEESLWADHTDGLEAALWSALRLLEENGDLARRLAERSREIGTGAAATRFEERAADASEQARLIQEAIRKLRRPSDDDLPARSERPA